MSLSSNQIAQVGAGVGTIVGIFSPGAQRDVQRFTETRILPVVRSFEEAPLVGVNRPHLVTAAPPPPSVATPTSTPFLLVAAAIVPFRLDWKSELRPLPRLHRQMYVTYGGYVVLAIVALGVLCLLNSRELAGGSLLARCVTAYAALFWGIRLVLQAVFDVKAHLGTWWLRAGYHGLTLLFVFFTFTFTWAAAFPPASGTN